MKYTEIDLYAAEENDVQQRSQTKVGPNDVKRRAMVVAKKNDVQCRTLVVAEKNDVVAGFRDVDACHLEFTGQ